MSAEDLGQPPPYSPELGRQDTSSDQIRRFLINRWDDFSNYVASNMTSLNRITNDHNGNIYIGSFINGRDIHLSIHPNGSRHRNGAMHVRYINSYIRINAFSTPDRNGDYLIIEDPTQLNGIHWRAVDFTNTLIGHINEFLRQNYSPVGPRSSVLSRVGPRPSVLSRLGPDPQNAGASPATGLALLPPLDIIGIGKRNSRKKRKTKRNAEKKRKTKRKYV